MVIILHRCLKQQDAPKIIFPKSLQNESWLVHSKANTLQHKLGSHLTSFMTQRSIFCRLCHLVLNAIHDTYRPFSLVHRNTFIQRSDRRNASAPKWGQRWNEISERPQMSGQLCKQEMAGDLRPDSRCWDRHHRGTSVHPRGTEFKSSNYSVLSEKRFLDY